jgi:hypothetical protein
MPVITKDNEFPPVEDQSKKDSSKLHTARVEHHQAAPGPVKPTNTDVFEQKLSNEEAKLKSAELNKGNSQ